MTCRDWHSCRRSFRFQEDRFNHFSEVIHRRHYAQATHAFPQEWISRLCGGLISAELRTLLDSLKNDAHDQMIQKNYNKNGFVIQLLDAESYPTNYS